VLGTAGGVVGYALRAGPLEDFPQIANPYGIDGSLVGVVGFAGSIVAAGSMVASAVSLIVRHRRARGEQRQQIKWLAYWGAVAVGIVCAGVVIIPYSVSLSILVMSLSLLGLPLFTGIAIVRHRLYDIDVLINRTLVYGSLTATLALVYFGAVTATQAILQTSTGQERLPQLVIVASTLVIAALFNPIRRRIQSFIDRRFYRRKYDARKTLESFSTKLRNETQLDTLSGDLVGVVRETMQPAHASLWLKKAGEGNRRVG
jgi:hypothetical protein